MSALIREDVEDVEIENVFQLGKEQDKALDGGRQKPLMLVSVKKRTCQHAHQAKNEAERTRILKCLHDTLPNPRWERRTEESTGGTRRKRER